MTTARGLVKCVNPKMLMSFDEIERLFEDVWSSPSSFFASALVPFENTAELTTISPAVDMFADGNELVMRADLPGIKKEDVNIDITGNILTISGENKKEDKIEGDSYYRFERSHGSFYRSFDLPEGVDAGKVKAHLENGVLELRIPKAEEAASKTQKIEIS